MCNDRFIYFEICIKYIRHGIILTALDLVIIIVFHSLSVFCPKKKCNQFETNFVKFMETIIRDDAKVTPAKPEIVQ